MKKITRTFAVAATALLMLPSLTVFSQSNVDLTIYKPGTAIAQLRVENIKEGSPIKVTLRNTEGNLLYSGTSQADRYVKMLDFARLKDGVYVMDIAESNGVIRKLVVKEEESLSIKDESYVFHNYIKFLDADKKLLVKFNNGIKEPVTLRISDQQGNIIHEETGIKTESYTTLFNLSKLTSGSYSMSLSSGDFYNNREIQL